MAEVMGELNAARDHLLDQNCKLQGCVNVKDVEEVDLRLSRKLLPRFAERLIPLF